MSSVVGGTHIHKGLSFMFVVVTLCITAWKMLLDSVIMNKYFCYQAFRVCMFRLVASFHVHLLWRTSQ